jgi:hypothetical protein
VDCGFGGGIATGFTVSVTGSSFRDNLAIGGSNDIFLHESGRHPVG